MQSLPQRQNELESFKRDINLTEYAASVGFSRDSIKSSVNTVSMKDGEGYCILVSLSNNNHWQYCSPHDDSDNGTIIDFVQKVHSCKLGDARKILRRWTGSPDPIPENKWQKQVKKANKDRDAVVKFIDRFNPIEKSKYLASRAITTETINRPIFHGRMLKGYDGAVIFPHWDEKGICGYEVKKQGFTSFTEKGDKSIWYSRIPADVECLIFCESGIESLSYAQLFYDDKTAYFTASGNWSPATAERIKRLFTKYENNVSIVAAYNHDEGGERQAAKLEELATVAKNNRFKRHFPETEGMDWNDVLQQLGAPNSQH